MVSKAKYYERKAAGLCVRCGNSITQSVSKVRCKECHEKFKQRQSTTNKETTIDVPDSITTCKVCLENIENYDVGCRKCLTRTNFTQKDAIRKYGSICSGCDLRDIEQLAVVSREIGKPPKLTGAKLFKSICQSKNPLPYYKVVCNRCYWQQAVTYLKETRKVFKNGNS